MARESEKVSGKIPVQCPHCGYSQLESPFAKSTFCRRCSKHFDVRATSAPAEQEAVAKPSIFSRIGQLLVGEKMRTFRCVQCGAPDEIVNTAQSCLCKKCGAHNDLRDFKITERFSRNLQTAGTVTVTKNGELTGVNVMCGEAIVQGKISGNLTAAVVRVKFKGRLPGNIVARELVVEKGSDVEFARSVKCDRAEIHGKISAMIMAEHVVSVSKTGALDGTVYAKSINIDRGGIFSGELFIGKTDLSQAELLSESSFSQQSLAFQ